MKMFGIGMAKTGLCSLSAAMQILGFKCMHGIHETGQYPGAINGIDFICDMPIITRYKEIDRMFPGSRFILTWRAGASWSRSAAKWMDSDIGGVLGDYRIEQFGLTRYGANPHVFKNRYIDHAIDVLTYFRDRRDDLLVMDICGGDGWEVLCLFVGRDIPDVPFPHRNRQAYK